LKTTNGPDLLNRHKNRRASSAIW